jgi:hypothetical protein
LAHGSPSWAARPIQSRAWPGSVGSRARARRYIASALPSAAALRYSPMDLPGSVSRSSHASRQRATGSSDAAVREVAPRLSATCSGLTPSLMSGSSSRSVTTSVPGHRQGPLALPEDAPGLQEGKRRCRLR